MEILNNLVKKSPETEALNDKAITFIDTLLRFNREILEPHNMKYCVVGSLALHMLGGLVDDVKDVDLEVICDDKGKSIFTALSLSQGNSFFSVTPNEYSAEAAMKSKGIEVTWETKPFIFTYKDVTFNVWCVSKFSNRFISSNGIKFAIVMDVLEKKSMYGRKKDLSFGMKLVNKISKLFI